MTHRRSRARAVAGPFVAALLSTVALLAGAAPAAASTGDPRGEASIAYSEPTADGLQILVSVPQDVEVDTAGVTVTIDGEAAEATSEPAGSSTRVQRTAILAIDTSNSMRGARFAAAKDAALQFLDSVPRDVLVGIVSFAGGVESVLSPSTDRDAARDVVQGLGLSEGTLLYDGVRTAVQMSGSVGQRSVLVLSDGADTSDTPIADVVSAVADSGVLVDVVALEQSGRALTSLTRLADAGKGRVLSAERGALAELFSAQAEILADQIAVTAQVPADVDATQATVSVTLPSTAGDLVAESFTTVRASAAESAVPTLPAPAGTAAGRDVPRWVMYSGVGLVGVGLLTFLLVLVPARPREMTAAERVTTYTTQESRRRGSHAARPEQEDSLAQVKEAAAEVLRHNRGLEERITRRLEAAGSELKASEWLLLHAAIFVVSGMLGLLLGRGSLLLGLVFLAAGAVAPWLYLGFRRGQRRKAFSHSLPDVLQLISGSLAAGLSLPQGVDTVVREGPEPVASEFKRVMIETRIGVSLEDAFEGVAQRFDSKDFAWVVMAIRIQRQVGGNLAELLDTVAGTMREREYMRRQVAALAAEGKLSAWVLGLLPPLFLLYLVLVNGDYVAPMFDDPLGLLMLAGAALWLGIGVFWMSRIIKVDV